jgi:hypothetical protein
MANKNLRSSQNRTIMMRRKWLVKFVGQFFSKMETPGKKNVKNATILQ